jgi:PII-like signaling protein
MKLLCLRLYVNELQKHHGILLYEWLLETAKTCGISEGIAQRSIAGYRKKGEIQETHFFELGSNVPVEVTFYVKKEALFSFFQHIKNENLSIPYALSEVETGLTDES